MTINKAKSSDYNTVNTKGIISYIKEYEYELKKLSMQKIKKINTVK